MFLEKRLLNKYGYVKDEKGRTVYRELNAGEEDISGIKKENPQYFPKADPRDKRDVAKAQPLVDTGGNLTSMINNKGQRVNIADGSVLGAQPRRDSTAPDNTVSGIYQRQEDDYYGGNVTTPKSSGGVVSDPRQNAKALINTNTAGMGESQLADLMRSINKAKEQLAMQIKSEGTAANLNNNNSASLAIGDTGQDTGIESLVDEVTQERNLAGADAQRNLLKKQLGLNTDVQEYQKERIIEERRRQEQDLQEQQARAKQDAVNLYFGGAGAPTNTTVAGIGESRAAQYDDLIQNVQNARADDLRQLDFDIRQGNLEAEALLMDFNMQERTAIVNEVQRRLNTRTQSALGQVDNLIAAGALTEASDDVLMTLAEQGGIQYGTLLALRSVEQQKENVSTTSFAELQQKVASGEASIDEQSQFYKLSKLQSEAEKMRKELEPQDNIVNGVNYTKLTEAADLAKKLTDSGASQETVNTVLRSAGASIAQGADVDFETVSKVIATAKSMSEYLSEQDVKSFLDYSLSSLGFNADVMLKQDVMEQLDIEAKEIANLKAKREVQGYLSPKEELDLQKLQLEVDAKKLEIAGTIAENSKTGVYVNDDGTISIGDAIPGRTQCGAYVNDTLGLSGIDRMGDTIESKMDSPNFQKKEEGGAPKVGGYFVRKGNQYGHVGIITATNENGYYVTDYNSNGDGKRDDRFIEYGSPEDQKVVGFGFVERRETADETTARALLTSFNTGEIDYETALTKIGNSKENKPIRDRFAQLVAEQGGKRVFGQDSESIGAIERQINNLEKLKEDDLYSYISGKAQGGFFGTGVGSQIFTPKKGDALTLMSNVISSETLNALANAKARGITFGALSEGELNIVQQSANNLASRAVRDASGNITHFLGTEKQMLEDINTTIRLMKKAIQKQTGGDSGDYSFLDAEFEGSATADMSSILSDLDD